MRKELTRRAIQQHDPAWRQVREQGKLPRRDTTNTVSDFVTYAERQGTPCHRCGPRRRRADRQSSHLQGHGALSSELSCTLRTKHLRLDPIPNPTNPTKSGWSPQSYGQPIKPLRRVEFRRRSAGWMMEFRRRIDANHAGARRYPTVAAPPRSPRSVPPPSAAHR